MGSLLYAAFVFDDKLMPKMDFVKAIYLVLSA